MTTPETIAPCTAAFPGADASASFAAQTRVVVPRESLLRRAAIAARTSAASICWSTSPASII